MSAPPSATAASGVCNPGNQRRFERAVLRRVAIIKVAQRAGISLADIRAALATLPDDRIRRLTTLRDQLGDCIGSALLDSD